MINDNSSNSPSRPPRLLPLHLTPFEYYMLADDSHDFPMTFCAQMEFSGTLDKAAITESLVIALERHPLLNSIVRPAKRNMECWVKNKSAGVEICWQSFGEELQIENGEYIDLKTQPGIQVWIQHDADRVRITTQFHHASTDGVGAFQFLGDWLHIYSERVGESELQDLPVFEVLPMRKRFYQSCDVNKFLDQAGSPRQEWREFEPMQLPRSQALRRPRSNPMTNVRFPGIESRTISKDDYRRIRKQALQSGLMPNDWCLSQFFLTLKEWNQQTTTDTSDLPFSVLVPMSLRETNQPLLSSCNVVTYSVITREMSQIVHDNKFSDSLQRELSTLKATRHSSNLISTLFGKAIDPEMFQNSLDRSRGNVTGVFANVGDPTKLFYTRFPNQDGKIRCGNLILESCLGVPPVREGTRVSVCLYNYRRELTICMRCEPNYFSAEDTNLLLDLFVAKIRSGIDDKSTSGSAQSEPIFANASPAS